MMRYGSEYQSRCMNHTFGMDEVPIRDVPSVTDRNPVVIPDVHALHLRCPGALV